MVKFEKGEDRTKVMEEGPWMLFDHYLSVRTWTHEFVSSTARIERTLVWIRFPNLNLVYYGESALKVIASIVGRPVKVDLNTLNVLRGKFSRVCVEINLGQPVVGRVWIRNHWYTVEYERLHIICSSYGCYGHLTRDCQHQPKTSVNEGAVMVKNMTETVAGNVAKS